MVAGAVRFLYLAAKLADDTDDPVDTKLIAYGFLIAFVTYITAGLGTERFYCESFWWVLVLPMCLYRAVVREAAAYETAPQPAMNTERFVRLPVPE